MKEEKKTTSSIREMPFPHPRSKMELFLSIRSLSSIHETMRSTLSSPNLRKIEKRFIIINAKRLIVESLSITTCIKPMNTDEFSLGFGFDYDCAY